MKSYRYLIVGGGLTGDAAVRGIRELDPQGSIGIVSMEPDPPYNRPSLSKGLWKGKPLEKVWRNTRDLGAEITLGSKIVELDPANKLIRDEKGEEYTYQNLLLAMGGSPLRLPFGGDNIIYLRDFQDYKRLRGLSDEGKRFLVIGGGFIGSEIAASLTMVGKKAVMVFPEEGIGASVFPADLSHFLNDYYRLKGVEIVASDRAAAIEPTGKDLMVRTQNGRIFEVDGIVAGIGIRPNLELAQQAGLRMDNGIIVNEHLLTSAPNIYAAGDVANFYHSALAKRVRVEHEDNAITMGEMAGRNMAGANESYTHVPMFFSDLFELGYEAVGELSSKVEMVPSWQDSFNKGVVYYMEKGRVRGILLWNVWKMLPAARALLAEPGPFKPADIIDRLPQLTQA
jgi:3-phenylpropionate/trans-cinnamate dioxygenase ferredoxin reductase component